MSQSPPEQDEYRPFPLSPGYLVSRDGRVFTCRHTGGVWKELKQEWRKRGPWRGPVVSLFFGPRGNARKTAWRVAKVVALAFLGPKPPGTWLVVRPVGSLRAEHMRYMTTEERRAARRECKGEQACYVKLTAVKVVAIRRAVAAAVGDGKRPDWAALSGEYGVCADNLKAVAKGKTWRHIDAGVPPWVPGPQRRFKPGDRVACKLTDDQARDILRRKANRERLKDVVDSYAARGVTKYIVHGVWYRRTYKWVKP